MTMPANTPLGVAEAKVRLVALVVTHNRQDQLQRTVDRLLAEDLDVVFVVDNASTDGTADLLHAIADPRLHVLRLAQNGGGAGGFESGLREVQRRFDPDWCVLMDDDARPEPGTMRAFQSQAKVLSDAGYEAVSAGVFYPDGHICEMNRPWRNPFWHLADFRQALFGGRAGFHVKDADYDLDQPMPIDGTSFVGFYISRKGLARGGLPDGRLFIYADDVIYTLKFVSAGGRICFAPWLRFEHDCTTYRRGERRIHSPIWKVYYAYRNALLAYRQASGPVFFWIVLAIVLVKWRLKARDAGADRAAYLRMYSLAVRDALRNNLSRSLTEVAGIAAG